MLFKVLKGSIKEQKDLEISCEEAFVMDFGDATFTSFDASTDWITFFDKYPQVDPIKREEGSEWYIGKIHSHHSMSAFHSGTDTQDLVDNAPKLPFFLSLVVNYSCEPFAEIAVAGETEIKSVTRNKWSLKNIIGMGDDKIAKKVEKKPFTYIIPCDVMYLTDQSLLDQIAVVREKNKPATTYWTPPKKEEKTKEIGGYVDRGGRLPINTLETPKGYYLVLKTLTDLLVLGQGTQATLNCAPALAYEFVDHLLSVPELERYREAIKGYFWNDWYPDNFKNTAYYEEDIIACIRYFLTLDCNRSKWSASKLNKSLNELEAEIKLLRAVQGHAVV